MMFIWGLGVGAVVASIIWLIDLGHKEREIRQLESQISEAKRQGYLVGGHALKHPTGETIVVEHPKTCCGGCHGNR